MSDNAQESKEVNSAIEFAFTQVWLLRHEIVSKLEEQESPLKWPEHYEHAALMFTDSLMEAMQWGNEPYGYDREQVALMTSKVRSISPGDVLVTPEADAYLVEANGMRFLGNTTDD